MKLTIRPQVLDKIRAENELTSDEQLAAHLGLTRGTVEGLRRGRTPSLPTFVRVMDAARITRIDAALVKTEDRPAA